MCRDFLLSLGAPVSVNEDTDKVAMPDWESSKAFDLEDSKEIGKDSTVILFYFCLACELATY